MLQRDDVYPKEQLFRWYWHTRQMLLRVARDPSMRRSALHGRWLTGRVPDPIDANEAHRRARATGLRILSVARQALGSLDRVQRVVKILGFVNAGPEFQDHPAVINGCSDLMVEVFGDRGRHSRSAVGATGLPVNLSVEIEAILEIRCEA